MKMDGVSTLTASTGTTERTVWKMHDGKCIEVRKMTDTHLLNAIRVLRGKSPLGTKINFDQPTRSDWLNTLANEAYRRELTIEPVDDNDPTHE